MWLGCVQARCLSLCLHLNTSFISSVLLCRSVRADHGDLIGFIPTYPSDRGPIQELFFKRGRSIWNLRCGWDSPRCLNCVTSVSEEDVAFSSICCVTFQLRHTVNRLASETLYRSSIYLGPLLKKKEKKNLAPITFNGDLSDCQILPEPGESKRKTSCQLRRAFSAAFLILFWWKEYPHLDKTASTAASWSSGLYYRSILNIKI